MFSRAWDLSCKSNLAVSNSAKNDICMYNNQVFFWKSGLHCMNARMSFPITMLLRLKGGTQTSGNDESKGQASFGIFDKISQSYLQFLKSASFF